MNFLQAMWKARNQVRLNVDAVAGSALRAEEESLRVVQHMGPGISSLNL